MDAMPNLVEIAENLPGSAWKELKRNKRTSETPNQTRARRPNYKEQFVVEKEYTNKRLEKEFVAESRQRCDQENIVSQLKAMGALSAPLHSLVSNWSYMVMATLAWNLNSWLGLSLTESCPPAAQAKRRAEKRRLVRMDFTTFRQKVIQIPAQILRSGRRLIYRLLTWTPSVETLFRVHTCVSRPLRH